MVNRQEEGQTTAYDAFARVFTQFNSVHSAAGSFQTQLDAVVDREAGLDHEQGLVLNVAAVLGDLIRSFPDPSLAGTWAASSSDMVSEDEVEALLLEHRTWELLHVVLSDQLLEHEPQPSPKEALAAEPYITPAQLTQNIVSSDPELRLWCTLLEHLQSRPILSSAPPLEARKGYLPHTLRRHKAAIRAGKTNLPQSLDPDFPLRTDGRLAGEDETYERPLLETLFGHVRHGELDLALDVLRASDESWRAASLQGGRLWSMSSEHDEPLTGNRNRKLWKRTCRAIASNSTLSLHERALYGSLVGHLPSTLPACHSWEDHLWAEIQARVEARLETLYQQIGGFWYQHLAVGGSEDDALEGGLEHVFERIERTERDGVADSARNPYRFAQKMIILGKTDILIDQFADQLDGLQDQVAPNLIPLLLRFFAHLVLTLRSLSVDVPTNAANAIIEAYVRVLEAEGRDELVAMYAACLREGSGEESYARFLRAMDPTATRQERQQALARAAEHHLDVAKIAGLTVQMVLAEPFLAMPPLDADEPEIVLSSLDLSDRDISLIRSIEWLTMTNETYDQALVASNALARYFLASGQTHVARKLFETLPADLLANMDERDEDGQRAEHEQIAVIFKVLDIYQLVVEASGKEPSKNAPKMDHLNWKKSVGGLIDTAHDMTVDVLHSKWLRFGFSGSSLDDTRRRSELRRIRHIFIPDLVVRLHQLLFQTRSLFPSNLQRALDLTKLVADERLHIYEEFMGSRTQPVRLMRYLDLVRVAATATL